MQLCDLLGLLALNQLCSLQYSPFTVLHRPVQNGCLLIQKSSFLSNWWFKHEPKHECLKIQKSAIDDSNMYHNTTVSRYRNYPWAINDWSMNDNMAVSWYRNHPQVIDDLNLNQSMYVSWYKNHPWAIDDSSMNQSMSASKHRNQQLMFQTWTMTLVR